MSEELLCEIKEWLEHCDPDLIGKPNIDYAHIKAFELFKRVMEENGYEIEKEPLFYAKSKLSNLENWENDNEDYFDSLHDNSSLAVWLQSKGGTKPRTIADWEKRNVTKENAEFEKVEE